MRRLMVLLVLALWGCDDDDGVTTEFELETDGAAADAGGEGMADAAAPNADAAVDAAPPPPPHLDEPEAWVYLNDPITDDGQLARVVMHKTTPEDGRLTSEWVEVFNCLNEDGGISAMPDLGGFQITVFLCHEVQAARPGPDGHYLQHQPPEDERDPNDSFAEVMMYHHVNLVHDYFKDVHGFADLDFPLPALVNVQVRTEPALPIPGLMPGPDGWIGLDNAAFFPRETWEAFAAQFGLPPRDSDSIIFFQGRVDFAIDARIIYHEYTHAVIGTGRLQAAAVPDQYGLDGSSFAMNEGLADYFAATLSGPEIGRYGIGGIAAGLVRDLREPRRCPDHVVDEVHAYGRVIGSAMWALREAVGAETADAIVYGALEQFTQTTTHEQASALMIAEAEAIDAATAETVRGILADFGMMGCVRSKPWARFRRSGSDTGLPHVVEGRGSVGVIGFGEGVPAYKQFHIDVPEGAAGIKLRWKGEVQSQLPGGPSGAAPPLDLSLRFDEPVTLSYVGGTTVTEDGRFAAPVVDGAQEVTLVGDCLTAERVYTLFFNASRDRAAITEMDIEVLDALPEDVVNPYDCGGDGVVEPPVDGGVPDAGMAPMDAGAEPVDAGMEPVDAGPPDAG